MPASRPQASLPKRKQTLPHNVGHHACSGEFAEQLLENNPLKGAQTLSSA
jgi:hypothetical protein